MTDTVEDVRKGLPPRLRLDVWLYAQARLRWRSPVPTKGIPRLPQEGTLLHRYMEYLLLKDDAAEEGMGFPGMIF